MDFSTIDGYESGKAYLKSVIESRRVPHAQVLVAQNNQSALPLALWYVNELLDRAPSFERMLHPDVHLVFPINNSPLVKKDPLCSDFMDLFRAAVLDNPHLSLDQWYATAGIEDKGALIKVDMAREILKHTALKPVQHHSRIIVIWGAEQMNTEAANKLLKVIEEPPKNTHFLLLVQREERMLQTISSRCQRLVVRPEPFDVLVGYIQKRGMSNERAKEIALRAEGSLSVALSMLAEDDTEEVFERFFVEWIRSAFKVKKDPSAVGVLLDWAERLASMSKEHQRRFLRFAQRQIRSAILLQYGAERLVAKKELADGFLLERFAPFVHEENTLDLNAFLEEALYNHSRNSNSKLLFSDMALQMTKLIHKPKRASTSP
jgi:DNA polymerase-3 subunit delta'